MGAPEHPFRRDRLLRRTWPFGAALLLAFAALPFVEVTHAWAVDVAGATAVAIAAAVLFAPWERLPRRAAALPALGVVFIAFLLRLGTGGLTDPVDFEALLLLAVFWLALHGSRREMLAAVALGGATFALSAWLAEGRGDEWVKAVLWPAVAALVGLRAQALVEQVRRLSSLDALTGVANRGRWEAELVREAAQARRSGRPLAVALVDLDHFKQVNDELGHAAGDELLRICTRSWTDELRRGDLLARYGGEEFGVLLPQTDEQAALEVAERLRRAVPEGVTCSVGVAVVGAAEEPAAAVGRADAALYRAKAGGRDRVVVDEPRLAYA